MYYTTKTMEAKTIVVKYGGNAMINDALKTAVIEDVVALSAAGWNVVLVHGGGPEIDAMLRTAGIPKRVAGGLRYTCPQTMQIVQMVLCGKINKELCARIIQHGGNAIGLCGIDGALFTARRVTHDADGSPVDLGLVGEISAVNSDLLRALLRQKAPALAVQAHTRQTAQTQEIALTPQPLPLVPVISPVALAEDEPESVSLNVNADTAAAKIAAALRARALVLMTDVPGLLRDINDSASVIPRISLDGLAAMRETGGLSGGMLPKTACCALALDGGVQEVRIIDGRHPHALHKTIAGENLGTTITRA
jgi:acetylglutamate kinase